MAITAPGAVDYHLSNSVGSLSINPQIACSLSCWINGQVFSGGTRVSMVGTYNTSTSGGTAIQIGTTAGANTVDCWTWGGAILVGSTGITIANGVWYHVVYTFDGTTHRLYINGTLNNTGTTAQLAGTITAVYINGFPTGGTTETGIFSFTDVSHFNRTLSASEILTMYTCDGARDGIVYGEDTSYFCNEGYVGSIVSSVMDESGHGNTLTPLGAAPGVNFVYSSDSLSDIRPVL